jgi:hypothetical protein
MLFKDSACAIQIPSSRYHIDRIGIAVLRTGHGISTRNIRPIPTSISRRETAKLEPQHVSRLFHPGIVKQIFYPQERRSEFGAHTFP